MAHTQKVILFGGTFDPIHNGHLHVALHTLNALNADQLIFIPARQSPHKHTAPTSGAHRVKMIELAIQNQPKLSVSDCELTRPAPSYTLDTILFFKKRFGQRVDLHWLIGADQLGDFDKWYRIDELLDLCKMTVMYRAGYPKPDFDRFEGTFGPAKIAGLKQNIVETPLIDLNSTEIRKQLVEGNLPPDTLPEGVAEYIKEYKLYQ